MPNTLAVSVELQVQLCLFNITQFTITMPTASTVAIIVTVINNDDDCYQNAYFNNESETVISGLPLASILRRSLGLPTTTFRGSPGSFKGSSLIRNGSCAELFCFAYDALCSFYNSVLSDNVTFSCTLSGMLVHHSSNRLIERPILVVLHVSSTVWWLAALPTLEMCFSSIHQSV